ncbi:ABC transporter ATP-binding protein [Flavobacterium gawalongense]|uniref:ABC transporter ATP-binding protein n=1 Tax=Flavobacterium gawalongense TaxID=2594432 RepID=A0A553BZ79_9FLAO|nr:ABC transporter ATP-binding protein [Flavobacterium gawalongense]TRX04604.1 ABC transporter ATP-binding protein [Flavobacterium gawalongense]TRX10491.1 ABC transporter ATP-binding protein [Flavobacterium gawalongense]TRX13535.1 ABC transporter ATP-binding protein [Flavobacterium gawalongense]TRX15533.1 ABC transporter ATP-binding protein [Flavobacterium gawalongense]TRX31372.1 ABC transporter ATP-binding protein [Flavobacterium gawalongense]
MLEIKNIFFTYIDKPVIEDVSFTIARGQNTAIIGESGCGKSTLLKLIYGLYDLDEGEITHNEKPILGPKHNLIPGEDYIKYLAQDFDLMPYITVEENVGKFLSNIYKDKKKARVQELLEMVEMTEFAKVKAKYLSGGQQQRVALARVLALEPEIILLDEPFSQIDSFRKNSLRRNLFRYLKQKGVTCIIATHDSADALSFSDETIVIQNGKVVAKGNSKELYENPVNKYIASLFGEVNELKLSQLIELEGDDEETLLLYPHQLKVVDNGMIQVVVKQCYFKGSHYLIKAAFEKRAIFFEHDSELELNQEVTLMLADRQIRKINMSF